jgi:predicted DNA binding CopG/RHH family protein
MKKKSNKNIKNPKPPKGMVSKKIKSTDSKLVKDSHVVYRSNKKSAKSPLYTNTSIGKIEIIKDFLPAPEELILKDSTLKVTLNLSKSSIIFFKGLAEEHGSQYQKIIRIILDSYSSNYSK